METLRGKISLDKINPLSQSLTNTHFYLQQKKSESYPNKILGTEVYITSNSGYDKFKFK